MTETEKKHLRDIAEKGDSEAIQNIFWKTIEGNDTDGLTFLLNTKEIRLFIDINKAHKITEEPPFMLAIRFRHFEIAKLLADHGADLYACEKKQGSSTLIRAVLLKNTETVKFLLETLKLNPTVPDEKKTSAFSVAKAKKHQEIIELLQTYVDKMEMEPFKNFLKSCLVNADMNALDYILSRMGRDKMQEELTLIFKNIVNECNKNGISLILGATQENNLDLVKKLIEMGANPLIPSTKQLYLTPLRYAYKDASRKLIDFLEKMENERRKLELKEDLPIIQLVDSVRFIKEAGHVMGLNSSVVYERESTEGIKEKNYIEKTEGLTVYESLPVLIEITSDYQENDANNHFSKIKEALEAARSEFSIFESIKYEDGNIVMVPIHFPGHLVSVTFYKQHLIVCNRIGDDENFFGTMMFPMGETTKITSKFIDSLRKSGSMEKLMEKISKNSIDISKGKRFSIKEQSHGTCAFVNMKSAIIGILYLLKMEELKKEFTEENKTEKQIEEQADEYAHQEYKKFTRYMRDRFVEKLIKKFNGAKNNEEKNLCLKIMASILLEHHGATRKDAVYDRKTKMSDETKRAKQILEALSDEAKEKMVSSMIEDNVNFRDLISLFRFSKQEKLLSFEKILTDHIKLKLNSEKVQKVFFEALEKNDSALVRFLLENEATKSLIDINKAGETAGNSPFMRAVSAKQFQVAQLLAEHGADLYACEKNFGYSALTSAVSIGNKKTVKFLLQVLNVNPLEPDGNKRTALDLAKDSEYYKEIFEILEFHIKKLEQDKSGNAPIVTYYEIKSTTGTDEPVTEMKENNKEDKRNKINNKQP